MRSVHTTRSTLQQHVRLPLRNIGGTDTFVHTLLRSVINDPRSNERHVGLHPADFLFLGPMCRFTAEDGDAIDARELLNASILNAVYAKTNVSYIFNCTEVVVKMLLQPPEMKFNKEKKVLSESSLTPKKRG